MKVAVFDTHRFERPAFEAANVRFQHELTFLEPRLTAQTVALAAGHRAVCAFVNDRLDAEVLGRLHGLGVALVALRSAGFDHVDLRAASAHGLPVVRVPGYSPHAVAEHAVALLMALNRKTHRAYARVREWDFSLDGLVGFDLYGKTVGVLGTGRIGAAAAQIFAGFGCQVLACDALPDAALAASVPLEYVALDALLARADVVSLHLPLNDSTRHLMDAARLARMKRGAVLINTGRGGLVDAAALLDALKSGQLSAAGLDVYEKEAGLFFSDHSEEAPQDPVLAQLLSFPNVLVTAHQAFLTREALANIADTTLANIAAFEQGQAPPPNQVEAK